MKNSNFFNVMKIFKDELFDNKLFYLKQISLWTGITLLNVLIFEFLLKESFEDSVNNIFMMPLIIGPLGYIAQFNKLKLFSVYSNLPYTISELYWLRFAKFYLVSMLLLILLIPVKMFGIEIMTNPFMVVLILFTFSYLIYIDMSVFSAKYRWFKRIFISILPVILLIALNIVVMILGRTFREHLYSEVIETILVVLLAMLSLTLSFQIFKLRKNYKV